MIPITSLANAIDGSVKPNFADYNGDENVGKIPHVDGTIGVNSCTQIGGKFVIGTIDAFPIPVVALCEFHGYYFKLLEDKGVTCTANVVFWKDPKTSQVIEVGGCFPPFLCMAPGSPGIYSDNSEYADKVNNTIPVNASGNEFEVKVGTDKSVECTNMTFDQVERKISINSVGAGHGVTTVYIPSDLLNGNFSVLLNGNAAGFSINKTTNDSIITVGVDYARDAKHYVQGQTIDILGTRVVPEFPYAFMALVLGTIVFLAIEKLKWNQISSFPK